MRQIILIAHNLRSCHNVGSLLRTAEGLAVAKVYMTGYTPYPAAKNDTRLPHLQTKINAQIHKTALGAEDSIQWRHAELFPLIDRLKADGYQVIALEQTKGAQSLPEFKSPPKAAIIVGREVEGLETEVIDKCSSALFIPMLGQKESYNVVQAAAMALYHLRFS